MPTKTQIYLSDSKDYNFYKDSRFSARKSIKYSKEVFRWLCYLEIGPDLDENALFAVSLGSM